MSLLFALILLASGPIQTDQPQGYLVSIVDVPLQADESMESFTLSTWGVTFDAVCQIPPGWTVKAGGSLTPEGVLEGEGSLGTSWFRESSPPELQEFTLVTLYDPVQREASAFPDGSGEVPATFAGSATVSTDDGERRIPLTADNVRLTPADRCAPITTAGVSGVFSNVGYNDETGDAGGFEVQIDADKDQPTVVFTICEGGCYGGETSPVAINGNRIAFTFIRESTQSDGTAWTETEDYEGTIVGDVLNLTSPQVPGADPRLVRVPRPTPGQTARLAGRIE
jgi:hypothetical protein